MLLCLTARDVKKQYSLLKCSLRHPNYVTLETEIVFKVKYSMTRLKGVYYKCKHLEMEI
jgi:hypothetical protein